MNSFKEHALTSGSEIINDSVSDIEKQEKYFQVKTAL
jgi:thioredoxin reductase